MSKERKIKTCIGCDKPCKEGLCLKCESKLRVLGKALSDNNLRLELVKVQADDT